MESPYAVGDVVWRVGQDGWQFYADGPHKVIKAVRGWVYLNTQRTAVQNIHVFRTAEIGKEIARTYRVAQKKCAEAADLWSKGILAVDPDSNA